MLRYALNDEKRLINIDECGKDIKQTLYCPYCNSKVSAKLGSVRSKHFAHINHPCENDSRNVFGINLALFNDGIFIGLKNDLSKYFVNSLVGKDNFNTYEETYNLSIRRKFLWQQSLEKAVSKGLISPQLTKGQYKKTALWLALERKLSLNAFVDEQEQVAQNWLNQYRNEKVTGNIHESIVSIDNQIVFEHLKRLTQSSLYFLKLKITTKENTIKVIYKIGVTNRNIETRIREISSEIGQYVELMQITQLFNLPGRACVEQYFKHKYRAFQYKIGPLTEYFTFDECISDVIIELTKLQQKSLPRRISGTLNRLKSSAPAGRPKGKEPIKKLLLKHQDILNLLSQNFSLREISKMTKKSINTVRKIKSFI